MTDTLIYRIKPQSGGPLYVPDALTNREGPQAREPSECLNRQSYGKRLAKRPSEHQLQEAQKKTLIGPLTPAAEAVRVPATWHHQGLRKPSICATFTLNPHSGTAATGKRSLASMHTGSLRSFLATCDPLDCGLTGFSVREGSSPGSYTGAYWPILVAIPF